MKNINIYDIAYMIDGYKEYQTYVGGSHDLAETLAMIEKVGGQQVVTTLTHKVDAQAREAVVTGLLPLTYSTKNWQG